MFLTEEDLKTSIYGEILTIIGRDKNIIETACLEAVAEVESYLSARYDTAAIFSTTGDTRNLSVLKLCKTIAIYNVHSAGNPDKIPDIRVKQYDDTITLLTRIQEEKCNIPGLPKPTDKSRNYVRFGGNRKRRNNL